MHLLLPSTWAAKNSVLPAPVRVSGSPIIGMPTINTKNIMGCIFVLGEWEGFDQPYPTFGMTLNAQPWSVMWGGYSELLHAVQQGSGFRLSFILVSHAHLEHLSRLEAAGWLHLVDFSLAHDPRSEIDQNWAWTAASIAELISARAALELASSS